MQKMTKDQIVAIGNSILEESDIIAKHGTSIANAQSILETGFNFHRTSMVIHKTGVTGLCSYGWKENRGGDAANVIIEIPKTFIKDYFGYDEEYYKGWIQYIKEKDFQGDVINSLSNIQISKSNGFYPPTMSGHIPQEFIRGCFIYCDGKNYLSFPYNSEEPLEHLTFVSNPNFYNNLTNEQQRKFMEKIASMRNEKPRGNSKK